MDNDLNLSPGRTASSLVQAFFMMENLLHMDLVYPVGKCNFLKRTKGAVV